MNVAPDQPWRLGHRPGLDGLRGFAILLVMADHSGMGIASGAGQLGVTIFFVLSGFLITALLLEERARVGHISLRRFYLRRALRLLPALVIFLGVVSVLMALAGRADEILGDVIPTLFYFMNWMTVTGNNPGLLSHTWSLSIEEQFYLIWPIALVALLAVGRTRLTWVAVFLVGSVLAALALRVLVWAGPGGYYHAYFGTDTRMDALAIGCLMALAFSRRPLSVSPPWMLAAAAAIPAIVWITDGASAAEIGLSAGAFAAAGLVAGAASGRGLRILAWRPLASLGILSYGLYLWHRPVMKAFTDSDLGGVPWAVAMMLGLSIGLAVLSRRLVEEPFLRLKDRYSSGEPPPGASISRVAVPPGPPAGTRSRR